MCIRNSAFMAICFSAISTTYAIAQDIAIYRWLDENNVVHFSQHQPYNDNYSQLTTFASYKTKQPANSTQSENKRLPSVNEPITQYEKEQADISNNNKVIAEKNCKAAQLNIKMLNSANRISISDTEGKSHVLTGNEKKAQVTLNNKHVDLYCKQKS